MHVIDIEKFKEMSSEERLKLHPVELYGASLRLAGEALENAYAKRDIERILLIVETLEPVLDGLFKMADRLALLVAQLLLKPDVLNKVRADLAAGKSEEQIAEELGLNAVNAAENARDLMNAPKASIKADDTALETLLQTQPKAKA
jgi:hypothetical protein